MDRIASAMPAIGAFSPHRGWFSAHDQVVGGLTEGAILFPGQTCGVEPQDSITKKCGMGQSGYQPWPAFWARADDALLLGNNGLWRNPRREFCLEANYHSKERHHLREDHVFARCWVNPPEELPGTWTSIASVWADGSNYYHWLFDGLTRLLVREALPESTRILVPSHLKPYAVETLEMLGLGGLATPLSSRPLRPERFYFCSPTAMTGAWNPAGCDWLRRAFAPFRSPSPSGAPVFFTRRGVTRVPARIEAIESAFSQRGFQIVDCAGHSVKEQIKMASEASAVAGIHGAAMTNLVWAHPGTPVLELFPPSYLNGCYEQIALQGKLHYTALVAEDRDLIPPITNWLDQL